MSDNTTDSQGSRTPDIDRSAPSQPPEAVEYEYVYEDENGNPIAPPPEGFNPEHFEEQLLDGEQQSAAPQPAPRSGLPGTGPRGLQSRKGTSRMSRDAAAPGRGSRKLSSRTATPEQLALQQRHARIKTLLMVGSILLIPILIIAIILTYCHRHGLWPFRRTQKVILRMNDYDQGRDLTSRAFREFAAAKPMHREGKMTDDKYFGILQICETGGSNGLRLMLTWREANPGDYHQVDERIKDANVKLREIREEKFKIEMRQGRN